MSYQTFKGISHYGQNPFSTRIEQGLGFYLNWAFLGIGGFNNVAIPSSGAYGGLNHKLRVKQDVNFQDGQVWQGFRPNWVWESGVPYGIQPTQFSGVKVNGTFYPSSTTGIYRHYVDFNRGQVVFNSPISLNSDVQSAFSFKDVYVTNTDEPYVKDFLFGSYDSANPQFTYFGSGNYSRNSIPFPTIAIEVVAGRDAVGLGLGGGQLVKQPVLFHVYGENKLDRDKLTDILCHQNDSTLMFLDIDQMASATGFPLTYLGSKSPNCKTFPDLVQNFFWKKGYLRDVKVTASQTLGPYLSYAVVKGYLEFEMGEI